MRYIRSLIVVLFVVSGAASAQIPPSYFSMHVNQGAAQFPLHVSFANFRVWDSQSAWPQIQTCVGHTNSQCQSDPTLTTLTWTTLDGYLAAVKSNGISDGVLYTMNRTPQWASSGTSNVNCRYYNASTENDSCYVPVNLNVDGSGSNNVWDYWVTQVATHVNDVTWKTTHAHVKTWEPWNEFFASSTSPGLAYGYTGSGQASYKGSWAQLLRMTEDTRCIIKGVGTIHNYPSSGSLTSCATYLAALPAWSSHAAIDSTALISTPSGLPDTTFPAISKSMQNFLYCNSSPTNDNGASTTCTWSGGANWGSSAVDVINFHFYTNNVTPEAVSGWITQIDSYLTVGDQAKALINGEGSDIESGGSLFDATDPYAEMGAVSRFLALYWSYGISQNYWYAYDIYAVLWNGSALTRPGTAWNTTYGWMANGTPVNSPFCAVSGTVHTCPLRLASGLSASIVWDSKFGPGGTTAPADCTASGTPIICGTTSYTVPATYVGGTWRDANNVVTSPLGSTVTIGAVPILLEAPKCSLAGITITGVTVQ